MPRDLYAEVTAKIVAQLEAGTAPWRKPWRASGGSGPGASGQPLRSNGEPYRGVNVLALWCARQLHGYGSPYWLTFKQALELGGHVKKGERSELVVYASTFRKSEEGADGQDVERNIPFLKAYSVFNADQCEGLPDRYRSTEPPPPEEGRIEAADAFFKAIPAIVRHGGNRAYYTPTGDHIAMPPFAAFETPLAYYGTLAHELVHWSGAEHRLARTFGKRHADPAYAFEELVAELGAAFTLAARGLAPVPREDHACYLASWIKALKADNRAIFSAASHAQRAADYLQEQAQPVELPVAA